VRVRLETELEQRILCYPKETVWKVSLAILRKSNWNVFKVDDRSGYIETRINMDLLSWTQQFYIIVSHNELNSTKVAFGRIGMAQPFDLGISKSYARHFMTRLELALKEESQI